MRRFVTIETSTPRARAALSAAMTGGEVRFGVKSLMLRVAVEKWCRRRVLRGVGGGLWLGRKGIGKERNIVEW